MTNGVFRISAIALGAAALVSLSPLSEASAATSAPTPATVHHAYAHPRAPQAHAAWRNGRRYAWNGLGYVHGYNPGTAVAAGVIGGIAGAGLGYPYSCYDSPYYGSCPVDGWGGGFFGPYWGGYHAAYGYGAGYHGHNWGYGHNWGGASHAFNGGGARFAGGNLGHMSGFGGGRTGGFSGAHFAGGGHFSR